MQGWEELERKIKDLLGIDKAKTVPGSGNGKGEEDVIGISTVCQCKFSEKKNVSILAKDMDRLKSAAELQDKLPLFANENNGELVLSFLEGPLLRDIMEMAVVAAQLDKIEADVDECQNLRQWNQINRFMNSDVMKTAERIRRRIKEKVNIVNKKLKIKFDDLSMGDLFEGVM